MASTTTVLVWETQRHRPVKGFSGSHLLPMDWPAWCDATGKKRPPKDELQPPGAKRWLDEWVRVVNERTDGEGWEYAVDFRLWSFHPQMKAMHFVRRRCWRRDAVEEGWEAAEDESRGRGVSELGTEGSWEDDGDVAKCTVCQADFTALRRRHHCRMCGKLVCNGCSLARESLPGHAEEVRVCDLCKTGKQKAGWKPGKALERAKQKLVGQALRPRGGGDPVSSISIPYSDGEGGDCKVRLSLRVRECRALASGMTAKLGLAGGDPNPYVLARCCGIEMRTTKKVQTHFPQWGQAEGSFASVPISDPSATLWLHVFDASPGPRSDCFIGRAAVPLPWLLAQPGRAKTGLWLCLLPGPRREGEDERATGDEGAESPKGTTPQTAPILFRGASPVSELLGMRRPAKPLGLLCVDVEIESPPAKYGVNQMLFAPPASSAPPDQEFNIELMQDNAARLAARLGPPTLLAQLWGQALPVKLALLPFWALLCWHARPGFVPVLVALFAVANGFAAGRAMRAARDGLVLWEDNNPYSEPSLRFKLQHKILPALKAVQSLQNPIGRAASTVSRAQSLLAWDDPDVSKVSVGVLLCASAVAGVLFEVLYLLPARLCAFVVGAAVMCVPGSAPKPAAKDEDGEQRPQSPRSAEADKAANFFLHSPDDREMQHRKICELLIVDPADVPEVGAQDRPDRLQRLDPSAPAAAR